jgi:hypothetical protein
LPLKTGRSLTCKNYSGLSLIHQKSPKITFGDKPSCCVMTVT